MSTSNRWIYHFLAAILLLIGTLLSGCSANPGAATPTISQAIEKATLRIAILPFLGSAPLFIAREEGYWAEEGLDMEYSTLDNGVEILSAMMQGDLDVSHPALGAGVLNAIQRGGQARMVAAGTQWAQDSCDYSGLVARKGGITLERLKSGEALRDLKVAASPVDMSGYYIDTLLGLGGNSLRDQEMADLPAPNLAEALESGSIDLAHASEPWLSRLLATGYIELLAGAKDVLPDGQFAVIMFGPRLIEGDKDVGVRFLKGYLKAVRQYNQGKTDRNVEIIAKYTGLDPEFIKTLCWPTIPSNGQINAGSIVDFQKWALEQGLIDKEAPAEEFVDQDYLKQAEEALSQ